MWFVQNEFCVRMTNQREIQRTQIEGYIKGKWKSSDERVDGYSDVH